MNKISRRTFVAASASAATLACTPGFTLAAKQDVQHSLKGRVFKSLKYNMIKVEGSLTDKFIAAREAGFEAIELDSPLRFCKADVAEVRKAIAGSGLPVDGTVCGSHWKMTHTSPDPEVRKIALRDLTDAIEQTDAVGGTSVLLVAGHGKDGTAEEIEARAIENISKALPTAARHGVSIVIENVWNKMHYDHDGDSSQTAQRFINFVDAFNSPLVGMQFDIGNHWKYGEMGDWIRQLGKRIIKLDLKGFSRKENGFRKIGEGDVDWADCREALLEINFFGYAAAEVGGGNLNRLKEISLNCNKVMAL